MIQANDIKELKMKTCFSASTHICTYTHMNNYTHTHTKEKGKKTKLPTGNMREKDTSFLHLDISIFISSFKCIFYIVSPVH